MSRGRRYLDTRRSERLSAARTVRVRACFHSPERLPEAVCHAVELRPGAARIAAAFAATGGPTAAADMLALSLGDRAWAELLEQYHQLARDGLARHRGWLMDTARDGFFAIFDEARDAIRAALDVQASARQLGLELRSGVHLGRCWQADEKCAGADVHVGARLATSAAPGEVLVSEEAAEQARQEGIRLADRGALSLKGVPGTRRVFATTAESQESIASAGSSVARDV